MSHVHCPTCGEAYEPMDYPVVWPWPGSCRCSADRQPRGRVAMGEREFTKLRGQFQAVSIPEPILEGDKKQEKPAPAAPARKEANRSTARGIRLQRPS